MISLRPIAVVVVAAAVAGVAVVGTRRFGTSSDPAQTTSQTPNGSTAGSAQSNPVRASSNGSNSGPTHADDRMDDDREPTRGGGNENGGRQAARSRITGNRQERVRNGSYITTIVGFYNGSGTAEVNDDRVSLRAKISTTDGRTGELVADNLVVEGPYFYGTGTLLGDTVQITGRVDAARASRLLAMFSGVEGKFARVVGNLPAGLDPGDDDWDNNDHPSRMTDGR